MQGRLEADQAAFSRLGKQLGQTVRRQHHVGVDEGHPRLAGRFDPEIAGRPGSPTVVPDHPIDERLGQQDGSIVRAAVDEQDLRGA
jgi:hypothetical protein